LRPFVRIGRIKAAISMADFKSVAVSVGWLGFSKNRRKADCRNGRRRIARA